MINLFPSHLLRGATVDPGLDRVSEALLARSFEDFDLLESGEAREYLPRELVSPPPHYWMCRVSRSGKNNFCMFLERNASKSLGDPTFLLSARRVGDDFYISRYEAFPEEGEGAPSGRFCAVLRSAGGPSAAGVRTKAGERRAFELIGPTDPTPAATFVHSWFKQPQCGAEIRTVDVQLFDRAAAGVGASAESLGSSDSGSDNGGRDLFVWDSSPPTPSRKMVERGGGSEVGSSGSGSGGRRVSICSQIPRWDPAHACLVMKFQRGRVKESSSKNVILFPAGAAGRGASAAPVDPSRAVVQFGKTAKDDYALDFRAPVSPLEAFALALSSFAFQV